MVHLILKVENVTNDPCSGFCRSGSHICSVPGVNWSEHCFLFTGCTNINELDPVWFRQKIAMVQQEPTLFACSIKENIAYGKCATDEEVRIDTNRKCDMRGTVAQLVRALAYNAEGSWIEICIEQKKMSCRSPPPRAQWASVKPKQV